MKIRKIILGVCIIVFLPASMMSQTNNVDLSMVYKIKQEGTRNSQIEDLAFWMTDFVGPRLTGSAGGNKANEWAKKKMEDYGFQNVRIEEARDFSRNGWDNLKTYAAMTVPYYVNFACNPVAWTGSTKGLIKGEVILLDVKSEADLEKYKGKIAGKIVMMPSTSTYEISFEPLASRLSDEDLKRLSISVQQDRRRSPMRDMGDYMAQMAFRNKIAEFVKTEGAAVVLNGAGTFNVPRSNGARYNAGDPEPIPELNLAVEAHGRMERLVKHNVPVEMEIEIQNKFIESPKIWNVIGEIPGTDKILKNEIVLIGAHYDSWHGGTGAADNASGCIVMMEALRILKSLGVSPRRTIRIALWGGEEQGLNGSRGYVEKYLVDAKTREHKTDYDRFAAYFNMDNGSGKYRGIYLQSNDIVRPIFEKWMEPFHDMGFSTIANRNTGGTDHLSFDAVGLPGFQFIQDEIEYGRGYHTVMDTYERLILEDLRHNAIITASFAYNAAMCDSKLPIKPEVKTVIYAPERPAPVPSMN